jgi:hypothetical protein
MRRRHAWMILAAAVVAGCLDMRYAVIGGNGAPTRLVIEPDAVTVGSGRSLQFTAVALTEKGDSMSLPIVWSALSGVITAAGVYTAGQGSGQDLVIARSGALADTAVVTVVPVAVAAVRVAPDTARVPAGRWTQFTAALLGPAGEVLSGRLVTWATVDPAIATSIDQGLVHGVREGVTRVIATAEGVTGTATIVVTPAPTTPDWPNEPVGYRVLSDQPWNLLTSLGWVKQFGVAQVLPDLSAPFSPPSVLHLEFPIGFPGGSAPGTMLKSLGGVRQVYIGIWWRTSNPWQGHNSNVNKIQYLFTGESGSMFMGMYGSPGGPYELRVFPQFQTSDGQWLTPNVDNVPVTPGVWHRIEWLVSYNAVLPGSGLCRWWMDGHLIGDYRNVTYPAEPLSEYKVAPVWGGVGDLKSELDYFHYDHIRVSVP